ncbi:flavoprotein-like protein [Mycena haematopus]|nr:flavoprotein-like protein [Mycena haematopus]
MCSAAAAKRVALVIASTRTPRIGPTISKVALGVIIPLLPAHISLNVVDLMDHPLPFCTADPIVPARLALPIAPTAYADPATNAWSAVVASFDAFIFLTPQHNWGYPASLKLALDALFHEWTGKPVLLVSYGGYGGGKAADQLRQVFEGMRLPVCTRGVQLAFAKGHDVCGGVIEKETHDKWRAENKKEELVAAWNELVGLIGAAEAPESRRG